MLLTNYSFFRFIAYHNDPSFGTEGRVRVLVPLSLVQIAVTNVVLHFVAMRPPTKNRWISNTKNRWISNGFLRKYKDLRLDNLYRLLGQARSHQVKSSRRVCLVSVALEQDMG